MTFELVHLDGRAERIAGADTYEQEGPLTTFFATAGREFVDSWSVRLASFRTADIASIRRDVSDEAPLDVGGSAKELEQVRWLVNDGRCASVA